MKTRRLWIALTVLFALGVAGSFFFFHELFPKVKGPDFVSSPRNIPAISEDLFILRLFLPSGNGLRMVEKKLPRRTNETAIAEAVIEEYFKAADTGEAPQIPGNVKLLGIYTGADQMFYIDLSDEVRRNFQGDALSEYLLLKGLFESLMANLQKARDAKIIVEGKELETLGGHVYLKYSLKDVVSYDYKGDMEISDE